MINGSVRKGQMTEKVSRFVLQTLKENYSDYEFELTDPRDWDLKFDDEGQSACPPELRVKVKEADGFIIITPEYNRGYPGSLKYLIDLNLKEYDHKPVAFVGVSAGIFGGTNVIENLLPVVRHVGLVASKVDMYVSNVAAVVDDDGEFKDVDIWKERVVELADELMWLARALKSAAETV